jgi:iron complex transport system ATP-binding protein
MSSRAASTSSSLVSGAEQAGAPDPPSWSAALTASEVTFAYPYTFANVIDGINIQLAPGDLTAIIGPNGSGKTTLLHLLSGALTPDRGQVRLAGRPLAAFRRQEIALRVAVVPQELAIPFPFTVRQLVEMGRTPHLTGGWWRRDTDAGRRTVSEALSATDTTRFSTRLITELSGGERQRAIIAMALAQQPEFLLLDEPTTHLDIQHQMEVLSLLQALNRQHGIAIMATIHDLNLAAMYFDRIILLDQGRIVSTGSPAEVFSKDRLSQVFQTSLRVERHPSLGTPNVILEPGLGQSSGVQPRPTP